MYTDSATVKRHFQDASPVIPSVTDEVVTVSLYVAAQLAHTNIDDSTERVKIIRQLAPSGPVAIVLTGTTPAATGSTYLARGSIVVANDALLTTVYTENDDYIVDYTNGTIARASVGSAITTGATVYAWFIPYTVLTSGSDYNIDYDYGTITRRAGSTIPSGATMFVDYSHSQSTITDDMVEQAIMEAEAFMQTHMRAGVSVTAETLKAAATYASIAIIILSQTFKELRNARSSDSDTLAQQLQTLYTYYATLAANNFSPFQELLSLNSGGVINNRFSKSRTNTIINPTVITSYRKR